MRDTFDPAINTDKALLVHETTHVDQYRRFRFEDAFACAYGMGFVQSGFDYATNPIEAEAFAVEAAYAATL
jgi:hypothetical protein